LQIEVLPAPDGPEMTTSLPVFAVPIEIRELARPLGSAPEPAEGVRSLAHNAP
jgi:hypothetical protein